MLACRCADCSDDFWGRISSVSVCGVATTSACVGDFACVCDSSRACPLPHNDQCPGHLHGWHFVHECALISLAENTAALADMLVARATRHWCCQHNCSQCPVGAVESSAVRGVVTTTGVSSEAALSDITQRELVDLRESTYWDITHVHWQLPPAGHAQPMQLQPRLLLPLESDLCLVRRTPLVFRRHFHRLCLIYRLSKEMGSR